jgi:hypothetical protein
VIGPQIDMKAVEKGRGANGRRSQCGRRHGKAAIVMYRTPWFRAGRRGEGEDCAAAKKHQALTAVPVNSRLS